MSDTELKALADQAWSLTETGKDTLRAEVQRRGLEFDLATAAAPEVQPSNLVTLRQFRDLPEALLAKSALESAGVESFLIDETTIRMDWLWSNLLGGVKLCINQEDAEAAVQILSQEIPEKFGVDGVGDFEQPRCPQCQCMNISFRDLDKSVAFGSLFLGVPIPLSCRRWTCQSCGYVWQPIDESKERI
jgi:hypothetical protein